MENVVKIADLIECRVMREKHVYCGKEQAWRFKSSELYLGLACAYLQEHKGYRVSYVKQYGKTRKVMSAPGTTYQEVVNDILKWGQ